MISACKFHKNSRMFRVLLTAVPLRISLNSLGLLIVLYQVQLLLLLLLLLLSLSFLLLLFLLLSDLMLYPGKKCHNRGHQPVVLGIGVFFFFHFISNTSVLFYPFQVNKASVMLQLSSLSLISLSISQSALLLFLMPPLLPV